MTTQESQSQGRIVPCLMFANQQHGRAEEAIFAFSRIFKDSCTEQTEYYREPPLLSGKVMHGRFTLCGQPMVAMGAHEQERATFSEGLSLQVMCSDQNEIDFYWDALSEGGQTGV